MKNKTLVFRADGNLATGMGHISRCLSMAQMTDADTECIFCVAEAYTAAIDMVQQAGFETLSVAPADDQAFGAFCTIHFSPADTVIVLDGYGFATAYQQEIKTNGFKLILIDDLAETETYADAVINTADDITVETYQKPESTQVYIGHDYALLRQPFLEKAGYQRKKIHGIHHLLISLGATDPKNITSTVLRQLASFGTIHTVTVLANSLNPHLPFLKEIARHEPQTIRFVENLSPEGMTALLASADLAIVSASNIANECIAVGVPLACIQTADNQQHLYHTLVLNHLAFGLGTPEVILSKIPRLHAHIIDRPYWNEQLKRQCAWFDGKSPERIRTLLAGLYGA